MTLQLQIDTLDGLSSNESKHYAKDASGKYVLELEGTHPALVPKADLDTASARVTEFRDKNIALLQERDALKLTLADLEKRKPDEEVAALTAKLATSEAARVDAQSKVDASVLKSRITEAFIKAGGRAKASDYIVGKASAVFTIENGALKTAQFSPTNPGQPLTLDEFLLMQTKESDFAFEPSRGGGAGPFNSPGPMSNIPELRDPTPQQLGRHADEIMAGKLRVVTSS